MDQLLTRPHTLCPRCSGRLFLEEGNALQEPEWACLNCGHREGLIFQPPGPRIREQKRRGLITHDFWLDRNHRNR
jgi:DNA-directed RNA polymerase subunit RPC12/RpoP